MQMLLLRRRRLLLLLQMLRECRLWEGRHLRWVPRQRLGPQGPERQGRVLPHGCRHLLLLLVLIVRQLQLVLRRLLQCVRLQRLGVLMLQRRLLRQLLLLVFRHRWGRGMLRRLLPLLLLLLIHWRLQHRLRLLQLRLRLRLLGLRLLQGVPLRLWRQLQPWAGHRRALRRQCCLLLCDPCKHGLRAGTSECQRQAF